ncbi:MAG: GNAT family N-acetyltransferase [Gemmatimonadota bacterium]|nr:GNAT family N-acetyltransferase [Gemmatimonadota bacterium]
MGISLRRASIADAETIHKLQVESFLPLLRKYRDYESNPASDSVERVIARLKQPQTSFYIVVLDVVPIGAIRVIFDDRVKSARISPMFIVPSHQGKGYGQEAIELIESAVQAEHWELETILQEKGNCHFYEKNGYRRTGVPREINSKMTIVSYEKSTGGSRTNERP